MLRYKIALKDDKGRLNSDWRWEKTITERYKKHRSKFLNRVKEFDGMWYGHFGRKLTTWHRIELSHDISTPCTAHFTKPDKLQDNSPYTYSRDRWWKSSLNPSQTNGKAPWSLRGKNMAFSCFAQTTKNWKPQLWVVLTPFIIETGAINLWEKRTSSQLYIQISVIGRSKSIEATAKRPSSQPVPICTNAVWLKNAFATI